MKKVKQNRRFLTPGEKGIGYLTRDKNGVFYLIDEQGKWKLSTDDEGKLVVPKEEFEKRKSGNIR